MKTTIEISNALLAEAEEVARQEGTTLRSVVEEGVRLALERRQSAERFRLRDARVGGRGIRGELEGASWREIVGLGRRGRGG